MAGFMLRGFSVIADLHGFALASRGGSGMDHLGRCAYYSTERNIGQILDN